ncbi:MAG: hypothetical protein WC794_04200 [Candidatus Doudnabacteria bacterium]|jgi:hypothetical protein
MNRKLLIAVGFFVLGLTITAYQTSTTLSDIEANSIEFNRGGRVLGSSEVVSLIRQDCSGYSNCYTSLASWQTAFGGISWGSCSKGDLVCANMVAKAVIDGPWNIPDTSSVALNGWVTGPNNYIEIYTTSSARHKGIPGTGYRITGDASRAFLIYEDYVRINGISIDRTNFTGGNAFQIAAASTGQSDIRISNNFIYGGGGALSVASQTAGNNFLKVWNNIALNTGAFIDLTTSSNRLLYVSNNTILGKSTIRANNTAVYKNNIILAPDAFLAVGAYAGTTVEGYNNALVENSSAGQTSCVSCKYSQTFNFQDINNQDYHLASNDTSAKDSGLNLASDSTISISDDIDGQSRSGAWDIGADEVSSMVPQVNLPEILSFSSSFPSVSAGESTTLSWNILNATSINIDQGIGNITGMNSKVVSPSQTTTYTLTASNNGGSVSKTLTISYTLLPVDTTAPIISLVATTEVTSSGARISWVTNENSDSQVEYGLTTNYGFTSSLDTASVTSHSVNLSALATSTPYHFRVKSRDSAGNLTVFSDRTFTTTAAAVNSTGSGPTIKNKYPYGTLPITDRYYLYFETDQNAYCRYSLNPNVPYASMPKSGFSFTGTTVQTTSNLANITPGNTYNYYVKCVYADDATNFNTQDTVLSFTVASPTATNNKSVGFFENPETQGETSFILQPIESVVSGTTQRVVFGVPFPKGFLPNTSLNTVRILDSQNKEVPVYIKSLLPWRNLSSMTDESSTRSVMVQMDVKFSDTDGDGKADPNQYKVEWGKSNRSTTALPQVDPKSTWVLVDDDHFPASAGVYEPKAYAVFSPSWYSKSIIKTRFNPLGTNPEFSYYDNVSALFGDSVTNNVDPRVLSANLNQYLTIGGTTYETWEYDRPMAIYQVALRSGYFRFLREGHRNSQFYAKNINSAGYSIIKPTQDAKYSYLEGIFTDLMLTGDESLNPVMQRIISAWQTMAFDNVYLPRMNFWTERHLAFRLLAYTVGFEALGSPSVGLDAQNIVSAAVYMQNNPVPFASSNGALLHTGGSHGGDGGAEYVGSPWMSALLLDSMERYYIHSGDPRVSGFVRKMADYFKSDESIYTACGYGTDPALSACNTYSYYLATKKTFNADGTQNLPKRNFEDDKEHALDVSKIFALAYFFSRMQGSPDQTYLQTFSDLYRTMVNYTFPYWIRPAAPESGLSVYRVGPGRKYSWWFKNTSDNDWLLGPGAQMKSSVDVNSSKMDLKISADKTVASPGDIITYTVTYRNTGTEDAKGVRMRVPVNMGSSGGYNSTSDVELVAGSVTGGGTGLNEIFWDVPLVKVSDPVKTLSFKVKILDNPTKPQLGRWLVPYVAVPKTYYCDVSDSISQCAPGANMWVAGRYTKLSTGNFLTVLRPYMVSEVLMESPSGSDTVPPSIPTNLSAVAISSSQMNLTWTASTDNVGVVGYKIYRGGVQIGTAITNNYNDKNLTATTLYSYTVSAYDAGGNASAQSSAVSTTTQSTLPIISNLVGSNTTATTTKISWNTNVPTNGQIFYGLTQSYGSQSSLIDNTIKTTTHSVVLTSLLPATTYNFKVTSVDALGKTASTTNFTFTTLSLTAPPVLPSPPTISVFTSEPSRIVQGNPTTLSFSITGNPTTLTIDNGVGSVLGQTSKVIYPSRDATYTLTATNSGGTATAQVVITITSLGVGLPPVSTSTTPSISAFIASPAVITPGQSANLSWVVTGTSTPVVSINKGLGTQTGKSIVVSPTVTTTYTLTATNLAGVATAQITVTVNSVTTTTPGGTVSLPGNQTNPNPDNVVVYIPPAVTSANLPNSNRPKLINRNGTYYLVQNNQRQGITDPGMLYTYGFDFKDAIPATAEDDALPEGQLLLPSPGSLVKSKEDPTVFLVTQGERRGFVSEAVFKALGFKFSSVLVVTNPELQALPKGDNLFDPSEAHPAGFDINHNGTIYWIAPDFTRQPYPSVEVYNSWHRDGDFTQVVPANSADLSLPVGGVVEERRMD